MVFILGVLFEGAKAKTSNYNGWQQLLRAFLCDARSGGLGLMLEHGRGKLMAGPTRTMHLPEPLPELLAQHSLDVAAPRSISRLWPLVHYASRPAAAAFVHTSAPCCQQVAPVTRANATGPAV